MSQLQSVLRRSVAHLDPSDHDGRNRVFVNAREAMIRLLWSYDPPLSPKEIDAKIDEFDDIVAQILGEEPAEDEVEAAAIDDDDEAEDASAEDDTDEAGASSAALDRDEPAPARNLEPAAMSPRRAEALAILRRPARFEPVSQIGSPTPLAAPGKAPGSVSPAENPGVPHPGAEDATASALLAKQAVEQALARLNGRLAPIDDTEADEDDRPVTDGEIPGLADDDVDPDAIDPDEIDAHGADPDEADAEASDEDDGTPDEDEPERDDDLDDNRDPDPDDTDDERDPDDTFDEDDDPAEDEAEDTDRHAEIRSRLDRAASRHFADDDDDTQAENALDDEDGHDRPTWRERLSDAMGQLSGRMIAAVAAAVILLAGGLLGTVYFLGRAEEPQQTAAAAPRPPAEQPAAPETPAPTTPAATTEAAQPPAAIPSGGLALETLSLFDGRDPSVFQSSPDNPIRFEGDTLGGFARISSSPNGAGSRIIVGRGVFERLAGRTVRIVVVARAAVNDPATSLRFSYQNGRGLSPWQDGALGADYAPLSLTWTVPKERGGPETDAVMIEPGIPGDGTAADVSSVRIEILK